MDSLTQAVLGAAVGQAAYGHRLGGRAARWGALGGLLPDADMVATLVLGPEGEYLWHRGPTHALWFGPVVGTLLGWALHANAVRRGRGDPGPRSAWIGVMVLAILTHPLLDVFTSYGTMLLWPFSFERFALNGIGIIDPLYTLPLVGALVVAWRTRRRPWIGRAVTTAMLIATTGYVLAGVAINARTERTARAQLATDGVAVDRLRAYPVVFQLPLRRVVARSGDAVLVGYASALSDRPITWRRFTPDRGPLVDRVLATERGRIFRWFAMDQIAASVDRDAGIVEVDDVRYGTPGRPTRGLWGIRATIAADGRVAEVAKIRRARPRDVGALLSAMWRGLRGRGPLFEGP